VTLVTPISGTIYEITVSGGDLAGFNGVVGLNLSGAQDITDALGNALPAGEPATDETYTVDNTGPTLTSFTRQTPATTPTNADTLVFRATFGETVVNVSVGDFVVNGTTTATVTLVTLISGSVYDITVSGGDLAGFNGVVGIDLSGAQDITDALGNALPAGEPATDETYVVDNAGPTVTVEQAGVDPTGTSPIPFTITFSEAVTGFTFTEVSLAGTAGATSVALLGGPTVYTANVSGMTGDGTVIASLLAGVAIDAAGNGSVASTSIDNTVTYDTTGPVVTIGAPSVAITTAGPVDFAVTITGGTTFNLTVADITLNTTGTATGTISVTNGATANPTVTISATTGSGTIGISIAAGVASDGLGNTSAAAGPSSTFIVDNGGPVVTASVPANTASVTGPTQLTVTFNEDVSAATGNNIANYLLLNDSGDGFDDAPTLTTCLTGPNPNAGNDLNIAINSAVYANGGGSGPFVSTLGINGGVPLPVGVYRLYVCGTTSIEDLVGNELNNGLNDTIIQFTVIVGTTGTGARALIPATGFAQGEVTSLPMQPADKAYTATNLWIEIPKLNVKMSIVGVPQTKTGWEVTWLGRDAGWLNGSAFPTWSGNSVLTGHVWDAVGKPGPFALLKDLKYGDQVKIHAFGQVFTYEIRESSLISPTSVTTMMKHEKESWITLITCEIYNEKSETYSYRRMVRAVLVSVTAEK
jgi:LPXTG-site transpeptidase (sortase) family protein